MTQQAKTIKSDVMVVGAGLVGLTAAIAMAKQGKSVTLVDKQPLPEEIQVQTEHWDARIYALTLDSMDWLDSLGVWQHLKPMRVNPIRAMQLWHPQQRSPLLLKASDAHLLHMGCILESNHLMRACLQCLQALEVQVIQAAPINISPMSDAVTLDLDNWQQIQAKLIIAADGVHSWVRNQIQLGLSVKAFNQTAIVANFKAELPHHDMARQWFKPHETLALLPLPDQYVSLVWALPDSRAETLLALPQDALAEQVEIHSGHITGRLTLCGDVLGFPLRQQSADPVISERIVLMGDAAHQVHPMAGQGVNLGFRDVMQLAEMTTKLHARQDMGAANFLRSYARARKMDVMRMNTLTSGLDALFSMQDNAVLALAAWGMQAINQQSWLKKQLVQTATL